MKYHDTSNYSGGTFSSSLDESDYDSLHENQTSTNNTDVGVLRLMSCMSIDSICFCNEILEINSDIGRYAYSGNNTTTSAATATAVTDTLISRGKTKLSTVRYIEKDSKNKNTHNTNIILQDNYDNNRSSSDGDNEDSKNVIKARGRSNKINARDRYDMIRKALLLSKNKKEDYGEEEDDDIKNACTNNLPHYHRQEKKNNRKDYKFGNDIDNNDDNKKVVKTHHSLLHKAMTMRKGSNGNSSKKQRNLHALTIGLPKFKKKATGL